MVDLAKPKKKNTKEILPKGNIRLEKFPDIHDFDKASKKFLKGVSDMINLTGDDELWNEYSQLDLDIRKIRNGLLRYYR